MRKKILRRIIKKEIPLRNILSSMNIIVWTGENILEMVNRNYEEFVNLYEIMEHHMKGFNSERRGKPLKNKYMDLLLMFLSRMKIGNRCSLAATVFRSKTPCFEREISMFSKHSIETLTKAFISFAPEYSGKNKLIRFKIVMFQRANRPSGHWKEVKL